MKRVNNLYHKICSLENLQLADAKAQKGKSKQYGVLLHNVTKDENLLLLRDQLLTKTYKTSKYSTFKVFEPKEREVFRLPYFPDRITHHAIMNILEPIFTACFTRDTYSCIKNRGIHAAAGAVKEALRDQDATTYCLKLDVRKFYPSIDHDILKSLLQKKFKDKELLWLLGEIIDSAPGVPIGNYLSQYFANFYLTYFDHWLKEIKSVKYYFRYADDIVILHNDKQYLHRLLKDIERYLLENLKLTIKSNWQVFPTEARGIDFVGYRFFHTHTLLRKSIKKRFAKAVKRNADYKKLASYWGWAKHCDSINLLNKLLPTNE